MPARRLALVGLASAALVALPATGCSSDSSDSSMSATSAADIGGNVTAPVVLSPSDPSATVSVGQVVSFDMGDPEGGTFKAISDDPAVFEVASEGRTEGSATYNAGGEAVGVGVAKVVVTFTGSLNGVGAPTTFTITVE